MTDVLSRPASRGRAGTGGTASGAPGGRPLPVEAALTAVSALAVTLVPVELVVLVAWAGDGRSSAPVPDVLRFGLVVLLAAHHVGVAVPHGVFALPPLGLTALPAFLVARSTAATVRARGAGRVLDVLPVVATTAIAYAILLTALAGAARIPGVRAVPAQAFVAGLALAGLAAAAGAARGLGAEVLRDIVPPGVRPVLAGAGAAALVLLAAGALLAGGVLAAHHRDVSGLAAILTPGAAGGAALVVLDVLLAPNAAVLAIGVLAGPGIALGRGTSVTVHAVHVGTEPALPILAAVPADGRMPAAAAVLLALPVLAGLLCGAVVGRRAGGASERAAGARALLHLLALGAAAGALAAVGLTGLLALAGGPVGPGRLAAVGASPWRVGGMLLVELAVPAAVSAAGWAWWAGHGGGPTGG